MKLFTGLAALASVVTAAVVPVETIDSDLAISELLERDSACSNGPLTRACWSNGFSVATDFDKKHPNTSATVSYHFTITNGTCNPDGHGSRTCFLINGQYPGPTIQANWGDIVSVTFTNNLKDNGTAIHFHGVRQLNSCGSDGVAGITQCPIAPGQTYTYVFNATQFGTSWYHSHFSSQYGDGIVGPIVFNGPATANYDVDLGAYSLTDWYYQTAFATNSIANQNLQNFKGPPPADNLLINGTNKDANGNGQYSHVTIQSGKKYRLRLVNTAMDNYIRVSLDNHMLQVITSDFIPVVPYYTQWILLAIGQRYDVVINANQTAGNYWLRANVAKDCASQNNRNGSAVWSYSGVSVADPTSTAYPDPAGGCVEPLPAPYWKQPVPSDTFASVSKELDVSITGNQVTPGGPFVAVWAVNSSGINVAWEDPTLSYIMNGQSNYPTALNVVPTLNTGQWNYFIVQQVSTNPPIPHPIHLHGHDFFVLGQGPGQFSASTANLNYVNPPRRDTASLYGGGWLAMAWESNNAGAWLVHCHIAWHISEGLGVQFLEAPANITLPDKGPYQQTCDAWNAYVPGSYWKKDDSGL